MTFEKFIARRYMKSKRRLSFITIIARASVLGVSVGVAALIVVLSVFNGFGELAKKLMLSAEPHIQVKFSSHIPLDEQKRIENFLKKNSDVDYFYKYVEGKILLGNEKRFTALTLKGIESEIFNSEKFGIKKYLTNKTNLSRKQIYIALTNAIKLNAGLGEKFKLTSFQSLEKTALTFAQPRVAELTLAGIYNTPNNDLNANIVFADLNDVKFLFDRKNRLSGYDIFLSDFSAAENLKKMMQKLQIKNAVIKTWADNHKQLFAMMKLERFSAFFLLALIVAVASFNILSSLTMSVTVKQKDIAVMRAFGATKNSVRKIFMLEGLLIGIKGTLAGFIAGLLIYFAQLQFKIYPLDASKYIIDALPVKLDFIDVAATLFVSLVLTVFAAIYPAKQAARINLSEAIKWE